MPDLESDVLLAAPLHLQSAANVKILNLVSGTGIACH